MNDFSAYKGVTSNFKKINELYIEVLDINRALFNGGYRNAEPLIKKATPEAMVFFGVLDVSFVELIDRIRRLKLEILDNIPRVPELIESKETAGDKISEAIYEYIFSGFAICMLEKIVREKIESGGRKILINADAIWEIFTSKLYSFKLPQLNGFFNDPANADIAAMFNLMSDSTYESLKKEIAGLENLKHNTGFFVREIIEKSIIEGMLLFYSYEEAKRTANY